jgi:hypothetical protein
MAKGRQDDLDSPYRMIPLSKKEVENIIQYCTKEIETIEQKNETAVKVHIMFFNKQLRELMQANLRLFEMKP